MITIKIEKKVPYSDIKLVVEQSIDEESYHSLHCKGNRLESIIYNLNIAINESIDDKMKELGIELGEDGLILD